MALKRTTEWTCDICSKKETIESSDCIKGLNNPDNWDEKELRLMISETKDSQKFYSRFVLMCGACIDDFKGLYSYLEKDKEPLKRPFYQKLFKGEKFGGKL